MSVAPGRLKRIRQNLTEKEREEISRTASNLRQWKAEGCPGEGKRGRPRVFFGMREEAFRILMRSCSLEAPDLTVGLNWGLAFDGNEAWRACIIEAYSPGFFWVGVEDGKKHVYATFQSPFAEADVLDAVSALRPSVKFGWASSLQPPSYAPPWPIPKRVGLTTGEPKTFFGLDEVHHRFYVGKTAAPAQRCGKDDLSLLGTCGIELSRVREIFSRFSAMRTGWYVAGERSLAKVAKLCSQHARRKVIEGE